MKHSHALLCALIVVCVLALTLLARWSGTSGYGDALAAYGAQVTTATATIIVDGHQTWLPLIRR